VYFINGVIRPKIEEWAWGRTGVPHQTDCSLAPICIVYLSGWGEYIIYRIPRASLSYLHSSHLHTMCQINDGYLYVHQWVLAALRARLLRAAVFVGSLTHKNERCSPNAHRSFVLHVFVIL
jgi:hypothetical protein